MAVDLYVGTLTRYYLGDWENVGQRWARENGIPYKVVRPGDLAEEQQLITDPEVVRSAIYDWREVMTEGLGEFLNEPLEWDESIEAPYFTDRPHWDGYAGLLLLAAHEENPEFDPPQNISAKWAEEPALRKSKSAEFAGTEYLHLLSSEMWLPTRFPFTFLFKDLTGHELYIGSAPRLLEELHVLNERTFKGTEDDRVKWRLDVPEPGGSFEVAAKFGLAVFIELAERAIENRLPLKLDY